jgi:hypothetical protein
MYGYNAEAEEIFDAWTSGTVIGAGKTLEAYYTVCLNGNGKYVDFQGNIPGAGNTIERVIYVKSEGLADHTSTSGWTSPAGLQPTASSSAGPTIAECWVAINAYLTKFSGSQNNFTFLISHDEVALTFTGLLDDYPGAAAAYSLRLLDKDYTGDAIRVRRASDNTEQDIGFTTDGDFDTTALATFCSGTNGFVKVWYDQSGNGNDAEQTSTSQQPKIYDSSTGTITDGGLPAVDCDYTTNTSLSNTSPTGFDNMDDFTLVIAANFTLLENFDYNFTLVDTAGLDVILRNQDTTSFRAVAFSPGSGAITVGSSVGRHVVFAGYGSNAQLSIDASTTTGTINISAYGTSDVLYINKLNTGSNAKAKYHEIICYPSDQSTNRTDIETNINDYYSIY